MPELDDLIGAEEAASILGVGLDAIGPMVEQDLLTVSFDVEGQVRFSRAEVQAIRQLGG